MAHGARSRPRNVRRPVTRARHCFACPGVPVYGDHCRRHAPPAAAHGNHVPRLADHGAVSRAGWALGILDDGPAERARDHQERPFWQQAFVGTTHCGAGCTLGDTLAEFGVFFAGVTLLGSTFLPELAGDFALAYLLGLVFQYFSIVPMRHLSPGQGIWQAAKADTLSLVAFEVGLFAWMTLMRLVLFQPRCTRIRQCTRDYADILTITIMNPAHNLRCQKRLSRSGARIQATQPSLPILSRGIGWLYAARVSS